MTFPGGQFKVSATVDIASIADGAAVNTAITIVGVQTDMDVVPIPPVALEAGVEIQGAHVTAQDTITLRVGNESGAAINPAAATWEFLVFTGASIAHQAG